MEDTQQQAGTPPEKPAESAPQEQRPISPTKFIVCVDKSDASRVAVRFACIKASKCDGLVTMLHVIEPPESDALLGVAKAMREEARAAAETMVQDLCGEANALSGIMPSILLREGKVGEEIVKAAIEDTDAKMLVLGVNPGSKRGKLVAWISTQMGESLLIPLLLVPGNLTDQQIEELS